MQEIIERILQAGVFAVVGASRNREKYGYLVFRSLVESGKTVYPINPGAAEIDGIPCYASLADAPEVPQAVVFVVPPEVTERIVAECADLGIKLAWMQEGAQSPEAVRACEQAGIDLVWGGPCIMVVLRTHGLWKSHNT